MCLLRVLRDRSTKISCLQKCSYDFLLFILRSTHSYTHAAEYHIDFLFFNLEAATISFTASLCDLGKSAMASCSFSSFTEHILFAIIVQYRTSYPEWSGPDAFWITGWILMQHALLCLIACI